MSSVSKEGADWSQYKGGGTTGARGALAPFKFAEGGLSPLTLWPYNTDCLLK